MNPQNTHLTLGYFAPRIISSKFCKSLAALAGLAFVAVSSTQAQISSINSAVIDSRVYNDIPGATGTYVNHYPTSISLSESGVNSSSGFADRDVWYFSNNGGTSAYQFNNNDYFNASFGVTLTGGTAGLDIEAGFLFSNPSGTFGGDLQSIVNGNSGAVAQFGGPSYYPFSPAAGGYPGAGGSVANYTEGTTYTMGLNYVVDPNTGLNAFEYSVNGVYAASKAGDPYFDLASGVGIGGGGNTLGGYFQIQTAPTTDAANDGSAVFSNISITSVAVPEPSTWVLLGGGLLSFAPRFLRRRKA